MAWVVERHFTSDERYCPDFEKAASPPTWDVSQWHKRTFDPSAGELVGWLRDESFPFPDFLTIGFRPVVCDKFREIVEELEPHRHQFLPVTIFDCHQRRIERKYWALNVRQSREAIIPEKSNVTTKSIPPSYRDETGVSRLFWTRGSPRLALSKQIVAGSHLWISWELQDYFFFSDTLMAKIDAHQLTKLDAIQVEEE